MSVSGLFSSAIVVIVKRLSASGERSLRSRKRNEPPGPNRETTRARERDYTRAIGPLLEKFLPANCAEGALRRRGGRSTGRYGQPEDVERLDREPQAQVAEGVQESENELAHHAAAVRQVSYLNLSPPFFFFRLHRRLRTGDAREKSAALPFLDARDGERLPFARSRVRLPRRCDPGDRLSSDLRAARNPQRLRYCFLPRRAPFLPRRADDRQRVGAHRNSRRRREN